MLVNLLIKKKRSFKLNYQTPLHYAAYKESKDMIKLLLLSGADITIEDNNYQNVNKYFD